VRQIYRRKPIWSAEEERVYVPEIYFCGSEVYRLHQPVEEESYNSATTLDQHLNDGKASKPSLDDQVEAGKRTLAQEI
jgi:hypothetical protein